MSAMLLALALAVTPPQNGFCVRNLTEEPLFFATDAGDGGRSYAELESGGMLCTAVSGAPAKGFVSVFASPDAIEGCSRLARAGDLVDLLEYADFDRCLWADPVE